MSKVLWKPGTMIYPLPPVMVSCGSMEAPNIITVAWTGIANSDPAMTYISLKPQRFSHGLIQKRQEFVINLTSENLIKAADFCGVRSGRDLDKFAVTKLTPEKCEHVSAPMIAESPVSLECRVAEIIKLGSHDMFLSQILGVYIDASLLDEKGMFHLEKSGVAAYCHGHYYALGRKLGKFGFSVEKKKTISHRVSVR